MCGDDGGGEKVVGVDSDETGFDGGSVMGNGWRSLTAEVG